MTAGTGPLRAARRDERPLTAAEEQLWLLGRENAGDPAYLVPFAVWVDGPLDAAALTRALHTVVARYDILRTVIRADQGAPVACVLPTAPVPCPVVPVTTGDEALAGAAAVARVPFAEDEIRLRARVFRVDAGRWLLLLVLHHAVCDASSLWVLLDELAALYSADIAGAAAGLPEPVQFMDVADAAGHGELDRLAREAADAVRSAPDMITLPFDQVGDLAGVTEGQLFRVAVPATLNLAVDATARRLAVSPNAVLLAAYGLLLDVVAGAGDVLVSMPVSRRASPAGQRAVGFLVHSVPVRLRAGQCRTVSELIRDAWAAVRHGWTHAAVSFGRVVAEVNPRRVPGMNPLCQCEFSVQTIPDQLPRFASSALTYQFVPNGGYKFSLSLEVVRSAGGRAIAIEYPAAMFRTGTVRRLAALYLRVLAELTADDTGRLDHLRLVSRAEEGWLAEHDGSERAGRVPGAQPTLAGRIEAAIGDRPADDAVVAAGRSLSYEELGTVTDELAAVLRSAQVAAGNRVAVLGERGLDAIVAVVAAVRMGASFVAIADDTPADRVARILAAARPAAVLVTTDRLLEMVPGPWRDGAVRHRSGWLLTAGARDHALHPGEAYVVFTSGSTGEPRGVSVPGTAIAAITAAWGDQFGLARAPARHLQMAPFSFDVFVGDLARSLCFGGTLVLAGRDDVLDPRRLTGLIRREHIGIAEFVPAVARLLCDYLSHTGGEPPTLRQVMVGSDVWQAADAVELRALLPAGAALYCTYGTSETAVDATLFVVGPSRPPAGPAVPIGRPFPGVLVSVRDRAGRPLPPRWAGELWVGGPTVADGYLSPDDPANDRFRTAPGPAGRPVRWYRTGDRVAWDEAGQLHLLGRMDSETKIRGVRVNPAEIEAVLGQHAAVTAAAVVAAGDEPNRVLAAFVAGPAEADLSDVAAHARRRLLPAAVPGVFRALDSLPATRHGKVDYRALTSWAGLLTRPAGGDEPAGELERIVAALTAEVIGQPEVGALDDFYARGASSVQLARLAWRISLATGREVSVRAVISAPSVRALCRLIEGHAEASPAPVASPAAPRAAIEIGPPSASVSAVTPPRRVSLTGMTGTLGPGILAALLEAGVDEVICVVRADNPDHARERVRAALTGYGIAAGLADDPRVRYFPGDLSMPDAGLSAPGVQAVTGADAVVNAAAWVNFVYPYELLAPVNVHGAVAMAQLAGQARVKPLHHLSTRSAVPGPGHRVTGGYNESKAEAERLLAGARKNGLPVSVYRPGFVLGALAGQPARAGLLESFLRECVRIRACPALPGYLNVVTADHVTVRIVNNVLSPSPRNYLGLIGSGPLRWSAAWDMLRGYGVELAERTTRDWLRQVAEHQARGGWFEPFLGLSMTAGLPELLSERTAEEDAAGGQPVADAWHRVCARLAELAGSR